MVFDLSISREHYTTIADAQSAALGIRVAANPFEGLVVPQFLVFDILVLIALHHRSFF